MKKIENEFKNIYASFTNPELKMLASKYGIPFQNNGFQAGCPGIMNPLAEQPLIELKWLTGTHNEDKSYRAEQFVKMLEVLDDTVVKGNFSIANFTELGIHGRVMFFYALSTKETNNITDTKSILNLVAPHATDGLNMKTIPFNKGGVSVENIFQKYIAPTVELHKEQEKELKFFIGEGVQPYGSYTELKHELEEKQEVNSKNLKDLFKELVFYRGAGLDADYQKSVENVLEITNNDQVLLRQSFIEFSIDYDLTSGTSSAILGDIENMSSHAE
jgi:hypothetical protein